MKIKSTHIPPFRDHTLNIFVTTFPENKQTHPYVYSYMWAHTSIWLYKLGIFFYRVILQIYF